MDTKNIGKGKLHIKKGLVVAIILIIIAFIVLNPLAFIKPGEYGVVVNSITGKIKQNYLDSGWHFTIPIIHEITTYPVTKRFYSIEKDPKKWIKGEDTGLLVPTNDNQHVHIDITIAYQLKSENLIDIYKAYYGNNINYIESNMLDIILRHSITSIISKYSMLDIYSSNRTKIQEEIIMDLNEKQNIIGFEFVSAFISDVRLTPEGQALLEAEARRVINLIEAQSQSEMNETISKSLTDELIKLKILEKLSPNLQLIIIPYDANGNIDLDKLYNDIINNINVGDKK